MFLACVYFRLICIVLKLTSSLLTSYSPVACGYVNLPFLNYGTGCRLVFNIPLPGEFTRVRGGVPWFIKKIHL
jgi:hypothetical protein